MQPAAQEAAEKVTNGCFAVEERPGPRKALRNRSGLQFPWSKFSRRIMFFRSLASRKLGTHKREEVPEGRPPFSRNSKSHRNQNSQ